MPHDAHDRRGAEVDRLAVDPTQESALLPEYPDGCERPNGCFEERDDLGDKGIETGLYGLGGLFKERPRFFYFDDLLYRNLLARLGCVSRSMPPG